MITSKNLILSLTLACAAFFAGCQSSPSAYHSPKTTNFLGIVEFEDSAYSQSGPATFEVKTDELVTKDNYSGNKLKLLWGLITISDH